MIVFWIYSVPLYLWGAYRNPRRITKSAGAQIPSWRSVSRFHIHRFNQLWVLNTVQDLGLAEYMDVELTVTEDWPYRVKDITQINFVCLLV